MGESEKHISYYGHTLNPKLTHQQITEMLHVQPILNPHPKTKYLWEFTEIGDGKLHTFHVYDYKGDRWHIGAESEESSREIWEGLR